MRTIRAKILFVTLAVVLLLGAVILVLSLDTHNRYKELQIAECRSLVDYSSARINSIIQQLEVNARDLALMGELYYRSERHERTLGEHTVIRNFESAGVSVGGGIWFEPYSIDPGRERVCFYAFDNGERVIIDENFEGVEYYYPTQSWYTTIKKGAEKGNVVWTAPYVDEAGTHSLMMTLGSGIYDRNDRFVGMSTVDWQLDAINESISSIRPTENSFALFADLNNDFILVLSDKNVREAVTGLSLKTIPWFSRDLVDGGTIEHNGVKYLTFTKTLDNNMIVVVNVPEDELFRTTAESLRNMVLVLVIASVVVAVLTYVLLDRFISRPIAYLTRKAAEIGSGELNTRIKLNTNDELAKLAESFNRMTINIREYVKNLNTVTAEKERIATELDVAREIQAAMLPSEFPEQEEFDICAAMYSAMEVGGDFYDFYLTDEDHLAVVIGDVSDKGVPAALFMAITRTLIRNYAALGFGVGEVFRRANNRLCENNDVGMFVTAFMGILDLRTGIFSYVNAGHNPPFIRRSGGLFEPLDVQPGFVLAAMEDLEYQTARLQMAPGDALFMYTDGVTEAVDASSAFFGEKRLKAVLNARAMGNMAMLLDDVKQQLEAFAGTAPQHDDITMLGVRFLARRPHGEGMKELMLSASTEALSELRAFVEKELGASDCSPRTRMQLEIAVEEIFSNIAFYGYAENESDRPVTIRMAVMQNPPRAVICFCDRGIPYNPLKRPDPDITLDAEERVPGGLGIFMAKKSVDSMEYEYLDGQNVLTITKLLL